MKTVIVDAQSERVVLPGELFALITRQALNEGQRREGLSDAVV
jgi:hypothetical protein